MWCVHNCNIFLVQWSCDSITVSLVLPGIESRQIYILCSKTCLNVLIWSKISISAPAQRQCNVTVFIPPADSLPPPVPFSRSIWISPSLLWYVLAVLFLVSEQMYWLPRKCNLYLGRFYSSNPCARAVLWWKDTRPPSACENNTGYILI